MMSDLHADIEAAKIYGFCVTQAEFDALKAKALA